MTSNDTASNDVTSNGAAAHDPAAHDPAAAASAPILQGIADTRNGGPMLGSERAVLDAWLEEYRLNVLLKIDGLTAEQLAACPIPPSNLSLLGIIRHLTEVDTYWLREVLHGEETPDLYSTREQPDGDFENASAQTAAADVETFRRETARAAEAAATWTDLDGPVAGLRHGEQLNLRWILTHLIEEYARHLGHMDLLREAIDGVTGY
ncbi:DinB family protein [Brachybacterium sp. JHP9]|uniref:DinB family protein n=1 Tax=Brachybacterium equifaecis TaxID=2910770 RepID=A0ABT0QY24_9MICO|nr:DinB family protein [Brachybacterium equifaecis]MCL6422557.1 DinB family protein [Brachybacterium equifaecis]